MRIDFHCHTKATKSGDGADRNVTPDLFAQKIIDADIKIVAITNHNHFDLDQYFELSDVVKEYCLVWPGIEIDMQGANRWHLIVIANPEKVDLFSERVNSLFGGKNINECELSIRSVYGSLNDCDVIYIPHFHKEPSISDNDREELERLVNDSSRIFLEVSNNRSLGVYTNYGYKTIVGSDVKDWNKYELYDFAELKLPVDSFHQFCLLSKRDPDVVDTLLNKIESRSLYAMPHEKVGFPLRVYQNVNVIFGPKGTGKTNIIKSLYDDMVSKGLVCTKYIGSEKGEEFKNLLSTSDMKRECQLLDVDSCVEDFKSILEWSDRVPSEFRKYVDWHETKDSSKNKRRMKITESSVYPYVEPEEYCVHKRDKGTIEAICELLKQIELEAYLEKNDMAQLLSLFDKLCVSILTYRKIDLVNEHSYNLSKSTIEIIKSIADKSSDTVSKPSSTGLVEFVMNRTLLLRAVNNILQALATPMRLERESLGNLENKGELFITSRYRLLCRESSRDEFKIGITKLREIVAEFEYIRDHIGDEGLPVKVDNLKSILNDNGISSLAPFIGTSKYVTDSTEKQYTPSNGEEGIILLQRSLRKNADAFFLDEPELGMGNSYIDSDIRPVICDLARQRKYIVIATHNANLAVRTLPYLSVYRSHGDNGYSTYIGNPFSDVLVNIENPNDKLSWSKVSLHVLEGGEEAFYERKEIYESETS